MKPNYGISWSDESETEVTVQFHLQAPDIPQVAECETDDTDYRHFQNGAQLGKQSYLYQKGRNGL